MHRAKIKESKPPVLKLATRNVRTMCPGLYDDLQQINDARKTAIVDRELKRLNIDIAALQEMRLPGSGSLKDRDDTFLWQGQEPEETASALPSLTPFCPPLKRPQGLTNTFFPTKPHHRGSWRHPRSRHWHQLDFFITRRSLLKQVLVTCSLADCDTDHSLVDCKVRLFPRRVHRSKPKP